MLVPVAVRNTPALVGVPVNAVSPLLAVVKELAAAREAELRFVTADCVRLAFAFAPYTEIVHDVDCAAHDSRCATAYSPAASEELANVNGWMFGPVQPCCRLLEVPEVVVPDAQLTAREALTTDASDVLFPKL